MTDKTDIKALRRWSNKLRTADQTDAFIDLLLDKLEAERQRADGASFRENHLNEMLNDKLQQNSDLRLELAALKAKLANPVVLPSLFSGAGEFTKAVRRMDEDAIHAAGFTTAKDE